MSYLYLICRKTDDGGYSGPCKIGISNDTDKRLAALQTASPYKLAIYEFWGSGDPVHRPEVLQLERVIHSMRKERRLNGEWFDIEPEEMRQLCELIMNYISLAATGSAELKHFGYIHPDPAA